MNPEHLAEEDVAIFMSGFISVCWCPFCLTEWKSWSKMRCALSGAADETEPESTGEGQWA